MRHDRKDAGVRKPLNPVPVVFTLVVCLFITFTAKDARSVVEFKNLQELGAYFDSIGYTEKAWESGLEEIPRVYIHTIPNRWTCLVDRNINLQQKKLRFFMGIMPLVLKINELILEEREKLKALSGKIDAGTALTPDERRWMVDLSTRYRVELNQDDLADPAVRGKLLRRVDIIPPSLALGQAACESGYGTSRFAGLGNALFGQWTWGEKGIAPQRQRGNLGNYKIAAFDTPLESVKSYAANLNGHRAYSDFRKQREALRKNDKALSGLVLADSLGSYSEKKEEYVSLLKSIIRANKLHEKEGAYLKAMKPVNLVPVDPRTCQPVL